MSVRRTGRPPRQGEAANAEERARTAPQREHMERERAARSEARELREEEEYRRRQQEVYEQRETEKREEEAARRRLFEEGENCDPDRFDELLKRPEELVRHGLAANPACTPELAERLADDDEEWVRVSALRSQAELLSLDTLDRLAEEDRSDEVSSLAESTLLKRSEQSQQGQNPQAAREHMERERAARSEARELREEKEYKRRQQEIYEQRETEKREEKAARRRLFEEGKNCAPDRFDELLKHPEELVRHGLAANPACTPELAERLADDDEEWVRVSALRSQAELLSDDTLDRLAEDRSDEVNDLAESTLLKRSEQKLQQEQCYSADTALQQMLVGAGAPQPGTAGFGLPQPALVGADNTPKCQKLVKATGAPCLLERKHRGYCRSRI